MKYKVYKHFHTNEIVYEEDWEQYALEKYNVKIIPNGGNGEFTLEQLELIENITEWYFSDNWIQDEVEDDSVCDAGELEDIIYERDLERKWGIA